MDMVNGSESEVENGPVTGAADSSGADGAGSRWGNWVVVWVVAFIFAAEFVVGLWILVRAIDALGDEPGSREIINLVWPLVNVTPNDDVILLLLVVGAGLLGSFVQSATSLVSYVGNRTFRSRWTMWYLLRAPIGVALALIIYLVLRGGLLQANVAAADVINPYGVAAFAGLAAMFSKQAVDKLGEVFVTMFRTESGADEERKDSLAGGVVLSVGPSGEI